MLNQVTEYDDDHYVSYLPDQGEADFFNVFTGASSGQDETALVVKGQFFILNGDWREEYAKCSSLEERMELFEENKGEYGSLWSE